MGDLLEGMKPIFAVWSKRRARMRARGGGPADPATSAPVFTIKPRPHKPPLSAPAQKEERYASSVKAMTPYGSPVFACTPPYLVERKSDSKPLVFAQVVPYILPQLEAYVFELEKIEATLRKESDGCSRSIGKIREMGHGLKTIVFALRSSV